MSWLSRKLDAANSVLVDVRDSVLPEGNPVRTFLEKQPTPTQVETAVVDWTQKRIEACRAVFDDTYVPSEYRETVGETTMRAKANWETAHPGQSFDSLPKEQRQSIVFGQVKTDGKQYDAAFRDISKVCEHAETVKEYGEVVYSVFDTEYTMSKHRETVDQTKDRARSNWDWDHPEQSYASLTPEQQRKVTMDQVKDDGARYLEKFKQVEKTMVTGAKLVANYVAPGVGGIVIDSAMTAADKNGMLREYPDGTRSYDIGSANPAAYLIVNGIQKSARGDSEGAKKAFGEIKTENLVDLAFDIAGAKGGGGKIKGIDPKNFKDALEKGTKEEVEKLVKDALKSGQKELLKDAIKHEVGKKVVHEIVAKAATDKIKETVVKTLVDKGKDQLKKEGKELLAQQFPTLADAGLGDMSDKEVKNRLMLEADPELAAAYKKSGKKDLQEFLSNQKEKPTRFPETVATVEASTQKLLERSDQINEYVAAKSAQLNAETGKEPSVEDIKKFKDDAAKLTNENLEKQAAEAKYVTEQIDTKIIETNGQFRPTNPQGKEEIAKWKEEAKGLNKEQLTAKTAELVEKQELEVKRVNYIKLKTEEARKIDPGFDPKGKDKAKVDAWIAEVNGMPPAVLPDKIAEVKKEIGKDPVKESKELDEKLAKLWEDRLVKAEAGMKEAIEKGDLAAAKENGVMVREAITFKINHNSTEAEKPALRQRLDDTVKFLADPDKGPVVQPVPGYVPTAPAVNTAPADLVRETAPKIKVTGKDENGYKVEVTLDNGKTVTGTVNPSIMLMSSPPKFNVNYDDPSVAGPKYISQTELDKTVGDYERGKFTPAPAAEKPPVTKEQFDKAKLEMEAIFKEASQPGDNKYKKDGVLDKEALKAAMQGPKEVVDGYIKQELDKDPEGKKPETATYRQAQKESQLIDEYLNSDPKPKPAVETRPPAQQKFDGPLGGLMEMLANFIQMLTGIDVTGQSQDGPAANVAPPPQEKPVILNKTPGRIPVIPIPNADDLNDLEIDALEYVALESEVKTRVTRENPEMPVDKQTVVVREEMNKVDYRAAEAEAAASTPEAAAAAKRAVIAEELQKEQGQNAAAKRPPLRDKVPEKPILADRMPDPVAVEPPPARRPFVGTPDATPQPRRPSFMGIPEGQHPIFDAPGVQIPPRRHNPVVNAFINHEERKEAMQQGMQEGRKLLADITKDVKEDHPEMTPRELKAEVNKQKLAAVKLIRNDINENGTNPIDASRKVRDMIADGVDLEDAAKGLNMLGRKTVVAEPAPKPKAVDETKELNAELAKLKPELKKEMGHDNPDKKETEVDAMVKAKLYEVKVQAEQAKRTGKAPSAVAYVKDEVEFAQIRNDANKLHDENKTLKTELKTAVTEQVKVEGKIADPKAVEAEVAKRVTDMEKKAKDQPDYSVNKENAALKESIETTQKGTRDKAVAEYRKSVEAVAKANPLITQKDAFVERAMSWADKGLKEMKPADIMQVAQKNMTKAEVITEKVKTIGKETLEAATNEIKSVGDKFKGDSKAFNEKQEKADKGWDKAKEALKGLDLTALTLAVPQNKSEVGEVSLGSLSAPSVGGGKGSTEVAKS